MSQAIEYRRTSAPPSYLARLWNLRTVSVFAGGVLLVTALAILMGRDKSEPTMEGDYDLLAATIFGILALVLLGAYAVGVGLATRRGLLPEPVSTEGTIGRRTARFGFGLGLGLVLLTGDPNWGVTRGIWALVAIVAVAGLAIGLARQARTSGVAWAVGVFGGSLLGASFWYLSAVAVLTDRVT